MAEIDITEETLDIIKIIPETILWSDMEWSGLRWVVFLNFFVFVSTVKYLYNYQSYIYELCSWTTLFFLISHFFTNTTNSRPFVELEDAAKLNFHRTARWVVFLNDCFRCLYQSNIFIYMSILYIYIKLVSLEYSFFSTFFPTFFDHKHTHKLRFRVFKLKSPVNKLIIRTRLGMKHYDSHNYSMKGIIGGVMTMKISRKK